MQIRHHERHAGARRANRRLNILRARGGRRADRRNHVVPVEARLIRRRAGQHRGGNANAAWRILQTKLSREAGLWGLRPQHEPRVGE